MLGKISEGAAEELCVLLLDWDEAGGEGVTKEWTLFAWAFLFPLAPSEETG